MALIREAHGNATSVEGPKLFDQTIVELPCPLARKESDDLLPSIHEFGAVSPARIERVREGHFFRITRIPAIFRQTYFLNRGLAGKWWEWWARCHGFSLRSTFVPVTNIR